MCCGLVHGHGQLGYSLRMKLPEEAAPSDHRTIPNWCSTARRQVQASVTVGFVVLFSSSTNAPRPAQGMQFTQKQSLRPS